MKQVDHNEVAKKIIEAGLQPAYKLSGRFEDVVTNILKQHYDEVKENSFEIGQSVEIKSLTDNLYNKHIEMPLRGMIGSVGKIIQLSDSVTDQMMYKDYCRVKFYTIDRLIHKNDLEEYVNGTFKEGSSIIIKSITKELYEGIFVVPPFNDLLDKVGEVTQIGCAKITNGGGSFHAIQIDGNSHIIHENDLKLSW